MADQVILQRGTAPDAYYISSADQVSILGDGTSEDPLRASGIASAPLQSFSPGTGDQQLELDAGKSTLRVTGSDEFLRIVGITPPDNLPDGTVVTFQNFGTMLITLSNDDPAGELGTRILFRAPAGNGYGINGRDIRVGGGSVQLVYVAGSGWTILVPTGAP